MCHHATETEKNIIFQTHVPPQSPLPRALRARRYSTSKNHPFQLAPPAAGSAPPSPIGPGVWPEGHLISRSLVFRALVPCAVPGSRGPAPGDPAAAGSSLGAGRTKVQWLAQWFFNQVSGSSYPITSESMTCDMSCPGNKCTANRDDGVDYHLRKEEILGGLVVQGGAPAQVAAGPRRTVGMRGAAKGTRYNEANVGLLLRQSTSTMRSC